MQELLEMSEICGSTVGKRSLEMVPNKFIQVEFGGVSRKSRGVQARTACETVLDHSPFMTFAAVDLSVACLCMFARRQEGLFLLPHADR